MSSFETLIPGEVFERLAQAQWVVALTGAGISAESGVPTFRDSQQGLWARYDPQQLATPEAFQRNPRLVWDWYHWRQHLIQSAVPNPGHHALAKLEAQIIKRGGRFLLISQNVDGLHAQAGSQNILELHGNIFRLRCVSDPAHVHSDAGKLNVDSYPKCPICHAWLRPDVVWFGETLSPEILHTAWQAAEACDFFFSIGTSTVIEPAASLPFRALRSGTFVVEINPNPTPLTPHASCSLTGPAGQILPGLVARF